MNAKKSGQHVKHKVVCRHWKSVWWLQAQDPPCPYIMEPSYCTSAAKSGNTRALEWLRAHGCGWTSDATYAAFIAGKMETLFWLRTQEPACEWVPLCKRWKSKSDLSKQTGRGMPMTFCGTGRFLLVDILTAARSSSDAQASSFFSDLTVEFLAAMNTVMQDSPLFQMAWCEVARAGQLPAMQWLCQHQMASLSYDNGQVLSIIAREGHVAVMELVHCQHWPGLSDEAIQDECLEEACAGDHRPLLAWLTANGYDVSLGCHHAARLHNLSLLRWMRGQEPPWPWTPTVC